MNEIVASEIIEKELPRLRRIPYSEWVRTVGDVQVSTPLGSDGKEYQVEVHAMWDSKRDGDIRVIVAVDDGGLRAFLPRTSDFIIRTDGTFVE